VYVEVQRHHEREEEGRNQAALRIAKSLKLPILATTGVRHAAPHDREVLDLYLLFLTLSVLDLLELFVVCVDSATDPPLRRLDAT
jgi:error-prone DNA polymerase